MTWFFAILVVLLMGGIAMVAAGRGTPLAEEHGDAPDTGLPEAGPVTGADLRRVRFPLALRGYRMDEVDALLARLADQLEPADRPDPAGLASARPDDRPDDRPAGPASDRPDDRPDDTEGTEGRGRGADLDS